MTSTKRFRKEFEIDFLEFVVRRAWQEQKDFDMAIFGKASKRTDSICQGLCRRIKTMLCLIFNNIKTIELQVKGKTHLVLLVRWEQRKYIIDPTIQQFLEKEPNRVFSLKKYPFSIKEPKEWIEHSGGF